MEWYSPPTPTIMERISSVKNELKNTFLETGTNITTAVKTEATKISETFRSSDSNARKLVTDQTEHNMKPLKASEKWTKSEGDNFLMFSIGRPSKFNKIIDENHRFSNYLRSKMGVIDLLPVDYTVNYQKMMEVVESAAEQMPIEGYVSPERKKYSGGMFKITYEKSIAQFQSLCKYHGLSNKYSGIRLFTTDDTTASDTVQVSYRDNVLQSVADPLTAFAQQYRNTAQSLLGSRSSEFANITAEKVKGFTDTGLEFLGLNNNPEIASLLKKFSVIGSDMVMRGSRMTFPKIWQSTAYNGNLSVNFKLVSPYGHPKAIKEFILKPLSYLVLLAAPQTVNGVTYGGNIPLTIKAYGLNYTVLGAIASITLRRGGNDTSFNLYRQPLSIDVSVDFQTLFDAFAVFDPSVFGEGINIDRDIFSSQMFDDPNGSTTTMYPKDNPNQTITTLGTVLSSLKPVKMLDMEVDPQVYGVFVPPTRVDIPDSPPFTPLAGNLGSSISSAVSKIQKVTDMISNAPAIAEEVLSGAVYKAAKTSADRISGKAGTWINKGATETGRVIDKVNSLYNK